jgi:GTPase
MIRGICSHYPDYVLMMIDAQKGLTTTAVDQFKLSLAFKVPLIIIIAKIDIVSEDEIFETERKITTMLKTSDLIKFLV